MKQFQKSELEKNWKFATVNGKHISISGFIDMNPEINNIITDHTISMVDNGKRFYIKAKGRAITSLGEVVLMGHVRESNGEYFPL